MDGDFQYEKGRLGKIFYGLDASKSYTKKDSRTLIGDVEIRKHAKLPKSALGYCTPLSLESNGTIFSGNKLRFGKMASIKKFASVFAKRVAVSAEPNSCQHCECVANNDGVTKMECMPCIYPTPITVDYVSVSKIFTKLQFLFILNIVNFFVLFFLRNTYSIFSSNFPNCSGNTNLKKENRFGRF